MALPDPLSDKAIGFGFQIANKILSKRIRVSCFAFGAEETGKTSFLRRLEGRSILRFRHYKVLWEVFDLYRLQPSTHEYQVEKFHKNYLSLIFLSIDHIY